MITLNGTVYPLSDPIVLSAGVAAVALLLLVLVLLATLRAARRGAAASAPLVQEIAQLGRRVERLTDGQHQLAGGLTHVSEAQASAQTHMLGLMEQRLAEVNEQMNANLHGSAQRTAQTLGALHTRLATIDRAQEKITRLSGDVLSLQDILSNKQTRGAFGEIQLHDILTKALPPDSYQMQATLSNGRRADCIVEMPTPPGRLVIDSKFPLEPYEALHSAQTPEEKRRAAQLFRQAVRVHLNAIAERYIIEGETADGAVMFLPSEAVYAELHGSFPELVREGFERRVWVVSPTTCMATLTTMRAILKDARLRQQAGAIRKELSLLNADLSRLSARVGNLDRHFTQAARDINDIKTSAEKTARRANRLDRFDFQTLSENESTVNDSTEG